jgi:hypothetical protein
MSTKAKYFFISLFLFLPFNNLYSQNTILDTNFLKSDRIYSKLLLNEKRSLKSNLLLKLNLDDLELIINNHSTINQSFSEYYLNNYGITPLEKNKVDMNLIFVFQNSLHAENSAMKMIREYLGVSKNIFAIILAIIHLAKYY